MECSNHPGSTAVDRCAGCAESFCQKCLVPLGGQAYCASCKVLPLKGMPMLEETTRECPEAWEALRYSLIGMLLVIFPIGGVVLGIMAIGKGATARKLIGQNPQLTGHGAATAGIIIGCMVTLVTGLMLVASGNR